ncbi:MAG: class I adenylate-forming enzyme family protein [Gammaproteobacteria bacterium]
MQPLLIGDIARAAAQRFPNRAAAVLGDRQVTFREVWDRSGALAAALLARGVRPGDRIAWLDDTSLDAPPMYFAAARIGAVFTPLNPRYTEAELAQVLARAEPAIVVSPSAGGGSVSVEELYAQHAPAPAAWPRVDENDTQIIFFTSGTTGEPKGCMLSHRTQRLRSDVTSRWPLGPNVCMFPQFHMAGWAYALPTWLSGDTLVLVERADAGHILEAIMRHRAHAFYGIPAVWQRIFEADLGRYDLSSLRRAETGTSATTQELLRGIRALAPDAVTTVTYGSTEASCVCVLPQEDLFTKPGSVGPPSPGCELRIDDAGELWVRNAQLFSGYFRNEEATAAALVDGWYRTGELAEFDEDGYCYIVGRAKDIMRTGGETVAPVEVDLVLQRHPAVADAAVAGIPDPQWGEVIGAFVVPRPGHSPGIDELRAFCAGQLASHKHPRRLFLVDAIPRTASTGQVQRRKLVEIARERLR